MTVPRRATVGFTPGEDMEFMVTKDHWYADAYGETAVFLTKDEAIEFCWKRWRVPAENVRVI